MEKFIEPCIYAVCFWWWRALLISIAITVIDVIGQYISKIGEDAKKPKLTVYGVGISLIAEKLGTIAWILTTIFIIARVIFAILY